MTVSFSTTYELSYSRLDLCRKNLLIIHDDKRKTGSGQALVGSQQFRRKMETFCVDDRLPHLHRAGIRVTSC